MLVRFAYAAELTFPDTKYINIGNNKVINKGKQIAGSRSNNYMENEVVVPFCRGFDYFIQIEITSGKGIYYLYLPKNGEQPGEKEIIIWSCANVEDEAITNLYMRIFGWREESEGDFKQIQGKIVKCGFDKNGENVPVISFGDNISYKQRLDFWKLFRKVANSPEGRKLLYRLLIEIRRVNSFGEHCKRSDKKRGLRTPLCIEYIKGDKVEDGAFLIDYDDNITIAGQELQAEKELLSILSVYLNRLQNDHLPIYTFLFLHTNFCEIKNIRNKLLLERTFIQIINTECGKRLIDEMLALLTEKTPLDKMEKQNNITFTFGAKNIRLIIKKAPIVEKIKTRNNSKKLTFEFTPMDANYNEDNNSITLRTLEREGDIVILNANDRIDKEKSTPVDIALFHELLHFYHFMRNPVSFYMLSRQMCIGKASYNGTEINIARTKQQKALQAEIINLISNSLSDTTKTNFSRFVMPAAENLPKKLNKVLITRIMD